MAILYSLFLRQDTRHETRDGIEGAKGGFEGRFAEDESLGQGLPVRDVEGEDHGAERQKVRLRRGRLPSELVRQALLFKEAADKTPQPMATLTSREVIFRSVMIAGLPLWVTLYSANAMIANYKSSQRITSHRAEYPEEGNSVLSKLTQDVVEEVMDDAPKDGENNVIKLNPPQSKIVKSLNKLDWRKFDVHIRKTQHSHAAIVCRSRDTDRLTEGHDVMEHWLDNVFLQ